MGEKHERPTREEFDKFINFIGKRVESGWYGADVLDYLESLNNKLNPLPSKPKATKSKRPTKEEFEKVLDFVGEMVRSKQDQLSYGFLLDRYGSLCNPNESKNARTPEPIWKAIVKIGEEAAKEHEPEAEKETCEGCVDFIKVPEIDEQPTIPTCSFVNGPINPFNLAQFNKGCEHKRPAAPPAPEPKPERKIKTSYEPFLAPDSKFLSWEEGFPLNRDTVSLSFEIRRPYAGALYDLFREFNEKNIEISPKPPPAPPRPALPRCVHCGWENKMVSVESSSDGPLHSLLCQNPLCKEQGPIRSTEAEAIDANGKYAREEAESCQGN